ncbi:S-adenosyl-L-methionine-dependent methyltransferase [Pseudomassariella vexata]|uniref:S-adenosyl-L-methionine-dependent methyltransferase n=1 Tax=Pseudomassariella vexata TaxID=1141098 RepID=A0A1Y2EKI2_9PEZI|nr:S-adenosyl-L-methionine-dependent methyltransferase [Pseudomassariella vexata]ORY72051.1 S-adenosyl-L-methionine-dependent methyltransferase [Pseudomassariella vexata]
MAKSRSLPQLAHIISSRANAIYDNLNNNDLPQPSFDYGAEIRTEPFSRELEDSRAQLLEAMDELQSLILGPVGHVFFMSFLGPGRAATLHAIYKFNLAKNVPLTKPISYASLASRCKLSEFFTRRYIRSALSLRIFSETAAGLIQHNAASAVLATTTLHEWLGMASEELAPAALKVAESIQRYPEGQEPNQSAFSIANGFGGEKDLFAIVSEAPPERMGRFADAMSWSMRVPGMETSYTVDNLGWSSTTYGQGNGAGGKAWCPKTIVDIGGGTGILSKDILRKYPGVEKAIVQDLPEVASQGHGAQDVPEDIKGRLKFQSYNFFTEQPVKGADVYLLRCVLHDWPDSYAVSLLRNQIPALKKGARLLFNERCLGRPGSLSHVWDQFASSADILMQLCANGKERSREDWVSLLAAADERFEIASVTTPAHSALSIIEVMWRGEDKPEGVAVKKLGYKLINGVKTNGIMEAQVDAEPIGEVKKSNVAETNGVSVKGIATEVEVAKSEAKKDLGANGANPNRAEINGAEVNEDVILGIEVQPTSQGGKTGKSFGTEGSIIGLFTV